MPSAKETLGQQSAMRSALDAGLEQLSAKQRINFRLYQRYVLDSDGTVFWLLTPDNMNATGSLHYATDRIQAEDETIGSNQMIFAAESEITRFNAIEPTTMWIGSWPIAGSPPLRVAFSQRSNYFKQADVWHYSGFAVYPAMQTQIIDTPDTIPPGPIVSNSLPIWLSLNQLGQQKIPVYPSFLVPENLEPPYIVAHIEPQATEALGAFPIIGPWPGETIPDGGPAPLHSLGASQLSRDAVTLTLYGFSNHMAIQYFQGLIEASVSQFAAFGFANSPIIRDEKRVQVEITALAQKKTIFILANYNQHAANIIARRLIVEAMLATITPDGGK